MAGDISRENGKHGGRPRGRSDPDALRVRKAVQAVMFDEYRKAERRIVARTIHLAENAISEGVSLNACHDILDRLHGRPVQPQVVDGQVMIQVISGVPRPDAKVIEMSTEAMESVPSNTASIPDSTETACSMASPSNKAEPRQLALQDASNDRKRSIGPRPAKYR